MAETLNYDASFLYCQGYEGFSFGGMKSKKRGRASESFVILVKNNIPNQVQFLESNINIVFG